MLCGKGWPEMSLAGKSKIFATMCISLIPVQALAEDERMVQVEEIEQAPVNCATAEGDMRVLQSEREHAQKSSAMGITAITPSGALIGLITGTEKRHLQMLNGDYIKHIDEAIARIEQACGT
jgi:hypothetical protein